MYQTERKLILSSNLEADGSVPFSSTRPLLFRVVKPHERVVSEACGRRARG
jgi:hypothetical protein